MKTYGTNQTFYLYEAARRFIMFNQMRGKKDTLTEAWTGLGSMREYKSLYNAGLMTPVHFTPRFTMWWKLTNLGAKVVKKLITDCKGPKGKNKDALEKINEFFDTYEKTNEIKCLDRIN